MKRFFLILFLMLSFLFSVLCGILTAVLISSQDSIKYNIEKSWEVKKATPSNLYDIKGRLITQFFSSEKRELVKIEDLPKHVIDALITREDRDFYTHNGFSLKGFMRAVLGVIMRVNAGGGSTLTQQTVGQIGLVDRKIQSAMRKFVEIWYAIQLEKIKSKEEILEKYLNSVYFGHNTYGIESACEFYFNHSAKDMTVAEAAILVVQLSNPSLYSPIKHPEIAKDRQIDVLDNMVKLGYITKAQADSSFKDFWDNYDYTKSDTASAFYNRVDKAPYFSEYIRGYSQKLIPQDSDLNTDGFNIYSTLDLDQQVLAQKRLSEGIEETNQNYQETNINRKDFSDNEMVGLSNVLGLVFGIEQIDNAYGKKQKSVALDYYVDNIASIIDLLALTTGDSGLRDITTYNNNLRSKKDRSDRVEGALLTMENGTGYITAMVGGSGFQSLNQFNRAMSARVEPGSVFKPLYYAGAIDKKVITAGTILNDAPTVFQNEDGTIYQPTNFNGTWEGEVSVRKGLAQSMNIPSVKVLSMLGFDDSIDYSSKLLGIAKEEYKQRNFVKAYPLALGVVSVSPYEIAKAFGTIENGGKEIMPITVRYITNSEGKVVAQPEKDIREYQASNKNQILSEQAAYIAIKMLESTTKWEHGIRGTLTRALNEMDVKWYKDVNIPIAGKTGTTQNWSDAWTAGFTPYYTTTVWLGFDKGGKSLGLKQTGAYSAGPIWARYMQDIHKNLPYKDFKEPETGLVKLKITTKGGLLVPDNYRGDTRIEYFIKGTEPTTYYDGSKDMEIKDHIIFNNPEYSENINLNSEHDFNINYYEDKLDNLINESGPDKNYSQNQYDTNSINEYLDLNTQKNNSDNKSNPSFNNDEDTNPLLE